MEFSFGKPSFKQFSPLFLTKNLIVGHVHGVVQGQGMRNAEMLVWAGDFNYRIDATYEDAIDRIRCNDLEYLLERVCNLFILRCNLSLLLYVRRPRSQRKSQLWFAALHVYPFVPHSHAEVRSILV